MFTIIGGDGKEYGPVTADQIRAWIGGGRANFDTKAKAVGSDEWRRIGDYTEFTAPGEAPPALVDESVLADRSLRLGAAVIDRACGMVVALPGALLLGATFLRAVLEASRGGELNMEDVDTGRAAIGGLVLGAGLLVLTILQIWMLTTRGQSIGKRIIGIRIVRAPDGGLPGFVHGWLLRNLVPGVISLLPWVGMMFVLADIFFIFGPERRCLHDYLAGTRVVKV
ncbi:MAG: hypothetical protein RIQ93_214 [Verrucomicrobiota bacterium]|jgi:uncharacterized RDD family membrane protein YckC